MHYNILTIIFMMPFGQLMANSCTNLLNSLAVDQMFFVRCSTTHSVPVTLCVNCKDFYKNMEESYKKLSNDQNCSKEYFDKDRINIISTMQSLLTGLWGKAFCDDCFTSDNVFAFENKSKELSKCFDENSKRECVACKAQYQDINNFYNNLDNHNNGEVCYDMQDEMNRTRFKWSNDFKCCKPQFNMTLFLFASTLSFVLPIAFYLSFFLYGRRRQENHDVIDAITDADEIVGIDDDSANSQENDNYPPAPIIRDNTPPMIYLETESDDDSDYGETPKNC